MDKALLMLRGNFTQRQFDALSRIWDNLQKGQGADLTLPVIQLAPDGGMAFVKFNFDGEIDIVSIGIPVSKISTRK